MKIARKFVIQARLKTQSSPSCCLASTINFVLLLCSAHIYLTADKETIKNVAKYKLIDRAWIFVFGLRTHFQLLLLCVESTCSRIVSWSSLSLAAADGYRRRTTAYSLLCIQAGQRHWPSSLKLSFPFTSPLRLFSQPVASMSIVPFTKWDPCICFREQTNMIKE